MAPSTPKRRTKPQNTLNKAIRTFQAVCPTTPPRPTRPRNTLRRRARRQESRPIGNLAVARSLIDAFNQVPTAPVDSRLSQFQTPPRPQRTGGRRMGGRRLF